MANNASAIQFFWKQDGLRRSGKTASRNGFVSGVLRVAPLCGGYLQEEPADPGLYPAYYRQARCYEILATPEFFGRQAPV
jgi:hypothetical protein